MENEDITVHGQATTVTAVRNAASNLRVQLEQLADHIMGNLGFPRALFNAMREDYLALFHEVLTERPHPNINLDYRRRRARRVHNLCLQFLNLRRAINAAVQNGQPVAQVDREHLAELRDNIAFYSENVHPE
ncbi:uncharacterized protein LOC125756566, partial [Rhipicephalus sanguineus]|uniref:uncharacterized protein LOC125756566 n=1 Tax=Rhipicephalus sanguineus TaxID=34632 RepID=UPI0020C41510